MTFKRLEFCFAMVKHPYMMMKKPGIKVVLAVGLGVFCLSDQTHAQRRIKKKSDFEGSGHVLAIQPGELKIAMANGQEQICKIQDKDEDAISLDGGNIIFRMDAKIEVTGRLSSDLLERGMYVAFQGKINRFGKSSGKVKDFKVISANQDALKLEAGQLPTDDSAVNCDVVGRIITYRRGKLLLAVPKSRLARQERVEFEVDPAGSFDISSDDLNLVRPGDTVKRVKGVEMTNGEFVIEEVSISLTAKREKATISYSDQLYQKYSALSDEPAAPRTVRSDHFVLQTDLSERSAKVLLVKLESMFSLLGRYYGKKPREPIECYVVRVVENPQRRSLADPPFLIANQSFWNSKLPQVGIAKIQEGAGVTASQQFALVKGNRVRGKRTNSVVFSCDNHGVVQHEAVHAYCSQAFGTAGPVWYAEGMAEMGQYWRPGEPVVRVDPVVIDYLTNAKQPKRMRDIVAAGQITGDSWKAYAWRWALCHLLANNPNYQKRFKRLGVNLMSEEEDSFSKAFGNVSKQISFEYDQFVRNFDNGYRVDLCIWEWDVESRTMQGDDRAKVQVESARGWQATPIQLEKGVSYDVICRGQWKLGADQPMLDASGNSTGDGRLIGVTLSNHKLSEPFELDAQKRFTAPASGQLYLRCKESWVNLADNEGTIDAYFRKTPQASGSSGGR